MRRHSVPSLAGGVLALAVGWTTVPIHVAADATAGAARGSNDAAPSAVFRRGKPPKRTPLGLPPASDSSRLPALPEPAVVHSQADPSGQALVGWSRPAIEPPFPDRRRRLPTTSAPAAFGHTLRVGERFKFDVSFANNPAGLAEAAIVRVEPDPRGGPPRGAPRIRIEGHARTSGVVSLFATVTDDMVSTVDARTGAPISTHNVINYDGWAPKKYRHRDTKTAHEGRGQVRIVDVKDHKRTRKRLKRVPIDTLDPLSSMAWVRSLELEPGERAKSHAMDGTVLLRVEITSKGPTKMPDMPSVGTALGLRDDDVYMIEGVVTRVDKYDRAIPNKRVYKLRAWLSDDERRLPLALESDMWLGSIRLELSSYDPPGSRR